MTYPRYRVRRLYPRSTYYHAEVAHGRDWLGRLRWQDIDSALSKERAEALADKYHSELPDTYEYVPKEST